MPRRLFKMAMVLVLAGVATISALVQVRVRTRGL